jgi:hypothetical protein
MAVTFMAGFEGQAAGVDGVTLGGANVPTYSTSGARTGAASLKCTGSTTSYATIASTAGKYIHFGIKVETLPVLTQFLVFGSSASGLGLVLNPAGTLQVSDGGSSISDESVALSLGTWYWVGFRNVTGTDVVFLQVDGTNIATTPATTGTQGAFTDIGKLSGPSGALYLDDLIIDDAGFISPSKVGLLVPISDSARASLWTGGAGGTTNLYDAVNNKPPIGTATETNLTQIEHAGGAAGTTDAYDANMTTYTTAGVGASDTLLAVQGVIAWGEDSATGAKLLSYSGVSNPAWTGESSIDVSTGHGSGALGTYSATGAADGWNERRGTIATSPSVTLGTSPVMRVVRPETATRVASVCFMGMHVAWTPAAANPSPRKVYPQLLSH